MELINRTAYNTEDLIALIEGLRDALRLAGHYSRQTVVSYFVPTPEEKLKPASAFNKKKGRPVNPYKFVRWEGRRNGSGPLRFGMIRPGGLFASPLEKLAAVSEDEMYLPPAAMKELTTMLVEKYFDHAYWLQGLVDDNHPVLKLRVRYSLRKERQPPSDKLDAEIKLLEFKSGALWDKISTTRCLITMHNRLAEQAEVELHKLREQDEKLDEQLAALRTKRAELSAKEQKIEQAVQD